MKILVFALAQLLAFQALATDKVFSCYENGLSQNIFSQVKVTLNNKNEVAKAVRISGYSGLEMENCRLGVCERSYELNEDPGTIKSVELWIAQEKARVVGVIELQSFSKNGLVNKEEINFFSGCVQL